MDEVKTTRKEFLKKTGLGALMLVMFSKIPVAAAGTPTPTVSDNLMHVLKNLGLSKLIVSILIFYFMGTQNWLVKA